MCKDNGGFRVSGEENNLGVHSRYFRVTKDEVEASGTFVSNWSGDHTEFAGLTHYRSLSDDNLNVCRVDFGLGVPQASTPSGAIEVRNSNDKIVTRLDMYPSGTNWDGATLKIAGMTYSAKIFVDSTGIYAQFGNNTAVKLA